jgi:type I restriction enzyme S subunit
MAATKNTKAFYDTEIPNDWEMKTLGEIATFINGKAYKQEELLSEGKYKVLRVGNFFTKGELYYSDLELEDDKYVNDGDLMYAWSASFGPQFWNGEKTIYHYHIWKVIASELITKQFLFFLLDYDTQRILSSKQGGTMFHITKGDMEKRKSNLPPLSEQKAIAQVLSTADAAIHTTEKLIAQKELRKKWLMQQLLTWKKRLKGFDGEWKEMQIGDLIKESRIPSINNDVNKRITVKLNLNGIEKRDVRGSEAEDATYYFIRKKGQFIYGKQNLHKGAFGIIPDELDGFESSQDIPSFDFKDGVNPSYFMFFMSQESFYQHLEKISTGTGSKRIHPENLFKVKAKLPSLKEQTAIAQVLRAADKEISLLKAKAEKLRQQKKGLMQVLLTGKKRLIF